jgi:transcriptional regulator with XRE-family HTH domain
MNSMDKEEHKKEGRVDPVDAIIAQRLFRRRCLLGYSQRDLADYAGVSIQQIQKYEKSTNRISGGRLYKFSKLLRVPIEYFFESIDEILAKSQGVAMSSALAEEQVVFTPKIQDGVATEKEVITLVKSYNGIKDRNVRRKFLELLRSVAGIGYV